MKIKKILVGVAVLLGLSLGTVSVSAQEFVQYVHTDALGSPVAISDANGAIVERTVYEPYGAVVGGAKGDRPGFTGHVSDSATGLTYMQQRYNDPELGRFLSVDPVSAYSNPVELFNRYSYAGSNPYRFVDPDGRQHAEMADAAAELGIHIRIALDQRAYRRMPPGAAKAEAARWLASSFSAHLNDERTAQKYRLEADSFAGAPAGVVYRRINPKTGDTYIGRADSPELFVARQRDHDKSLGVQHEYDVVDRATPGLALQVAEETQIRAHGGLRKEGGGLVNKRHEMRESRYQTAGGREPPALGTRIRRSR